jgi:short-subunit dehydrogenase
LAECCAREGFDLLIGADEAEIEDAADRLRRQSVKVTAIQADLATLEGVDTLYRTGLTCTTSSRTKRMAASRW